MKKILMLTIVFVAIALLPQSAIAQKEVKVKTTEKKELKTKAPAKKAAKGDVVPLRNPNAKQTKTTEQNEKDVKRVPFTRANKTKAKDEKKIELLVRPLDKKDGKEKKKLKQKKAEVQNQ